MKNMPLKLAMLGVALGVVTATAQYDRGPNRPAYPREGVRQPGKIWSDTAIAYSREFTWMKRAAESLLKDDPAEDERARLEQIIADATFLQQRWAAWINRQGEAYLPGRDRYFERLKQLTGMLRQAEKTESAEERDELITTVAEDMQLKAANCKASEDGLGKSVEVRVNTVGADGAQSGYQVWFVPRGFFSVEAEHDRFHRLSSPTETIQVPPGGYLMWAEKGGRKTEPVVQRLGGKGREETLIDLVVPAED